MPSSQSLPKSEKNKIIETIKSKLPAKPGGLVCPMCQQKEFEIEEAYFIQLTQINYHKLRNGGKIVPMAPLVCQNCGFVANFALRPLGLYRG